MHVIIGSMCGSCHCKPWCLIAHSLLPAFQSVCTMRGQIFRPWRTLEELHEVELLLYNDEGIREKFPDDSSTLRDRGITHVGEQPFTSHFQALEDLIILRNSYPSL